MYILKDKRVVRAQFATWMFCPQGTCSGDCYGQKLARSIHGEQKHQIW